VDAFPSAVKIKGWLERIECIINVLHIIQADPFHPIKEKTGDAFPGKFLAMSAGKRAEHLDVVVTLNNNGGNKNFDELEWLLTKPDYK